MARFSKNFSSMTELSNFKQDSSHQKEILRISSKLAIKKTEKIGHYEKNGQKDKQISVVLNEKCSFLSRFSL